MSEKAPKYEQSQTPEKQQAEEVLEQIESLRAFVRENPDSPLLSQIRALIAPADYSPESDTEPEPMSEAPVSEQPATEETPPESHPVQPVEKSEREISSFMTFEKARTQKAELPDAFIQDALENKLQKPGGEKAFNIKHFFDRVPSDASDKEFVTNHEEAIAFHDKLGDFIIKELRVHTPAKYQGYLAEKQREYFAKIKADSAQLRHYIDGWENGLTAAQNRLPRNALDFNGLTMPTTTMNSVNLLEHKINDIDANLFLQNSIMGNFVQWSSGEYMKRKIEEGRREPFAHRVYLNPRPQDSVEVFSDIVQTIDSAGLAAKAKIYDRTFDSEVMLSQKDAASGHGDMRADSIVVYATEEDAEEILRIAQGVREKHEDSFKGRQSSSVPFEIGEGVAIGAEPKRQGESLTSHRAEVIGRVVQKVRSAGETDPDKQATLFRNLWRSEALGEGINPDNPAFNHG